MSALYVLARALSSESRTEELLRAPEFRKATRNMRLAASAIEAVWPSVNKLELDSMAVILGSSFGESEMTKEFLSYWAVQKVARPLLFQNSLHNATLGFLSLHFGFRGPSFTLSNRSFTAEACLETAQILLATEQCRSCLVVCVESQSPQLQSAVQASYPAGFQIVDGAAALLLSLTPGAQPGPVIDSIERVPSRPASATATDYYDSDGLKKMIEAWDRGDAGPRLYLHKPGSLSTQLTWSWR